MYASQTPRTWNGCAELTGMADGRGKCEYADLVVGNAEICRRIPKSFRTVQLRSRERKAVPKSTTWEIDCSEAIVQSECGVTLVEGGKI